MAQAYVWGAHLSVGLPLLAEKEKPHNSRLLNDDLRIVTFLAYSQLSLQSYPAYAGPSKMILILHTYLFCLWEVVGLHSKMEKDITCDEKGMNKELKIMCFDTLM